MSKISRAMVENLPMPRPSLFAEMALHPTATEDRLATQFGGAGAAGRICREVHLALMCMIAETLNK